MTALDPLIWLVNGLLALAHILLDHSLLLVAPPPLAWLTWTSPREQRAWVTAAGGLSLLAALWVPAPIPLIVAIMAWAGAVAVRLDRFNPASPRWRGPRAGGGA